jgi:hypothetical protein
MTRQRPTLEPVLARPHCRDGPLGQPSRANRSASRQRILRVLGFNPEAASGDGPGERSRQVLNADGVRLPATGLEHDADPT